MGAIKIKDQRPALNGQEEGRDRIATQYFNKFFKNIQHKSFVL